MGTSKLAGSARQPMLRARVIADADPAERLEVTVLVRRNNRDKFSERNLEAHRLGKSGYLSRSEFAKQYGAKSADIEAVRKFAGEHNVSVVQDDPARRTVVLSGTVAQFNAAFGVRLQKHAYPGGTYRGRIGEIHLPESLEHIVEAVLGLDNRPAARPLFRVRRMAGNVRWHADPGGATSFSPIQLASLYNFPEGTGKGETIAIIELGGGERPADLEAYFSALGIDAPKVITVSVDHGQNQPTGDPNGPDGEVMLDIEVVGAVVPEAKIVVYFAPNTDAGFLDAITTAIHDSTNNPSIVSISWGGPEIAWTSQAMAAFDSAFQAAVSMGVTVCVASGDDGSNDTVNDGAAHVNFPASSPNVLACGGTSIQASGNTITSETVWNDGPGNGATGGGLSNQFPVPVWQQGLQATLAAGGTEALTMRGVPDVAGDADPETGYEVRIDGTDTVIGGTSAAAPLWAGLIARINAKNGAPAGLINPKLYGAPVAFNPITQGNNGAYAASAGWNACCGLGSPNGSAVVGVLSETKNQ